MHFRACGRDLPPELYLAGKKRLSSFLYEKRM